jgi:long-chain acyl-CoA synthetase
MSNFWEDNALKRVRIHDANKGWIKSNTIIDLADKAVSKLPSRSLFALRFFANLDCVSAYLGALRQGHVPLLIGSDLSDEFIAPLCNRFGIKHLFNGGTGEWSELSGDLKKHSLHPDLGLLMPTSGSTGSFKLVRLTKENLAENAKSISNYLELTPEDCAITSLPLNYSYGLSVLNSHFAAGARVILDDSSITTQNFWTKVRDEGVTGLAGVPTTWRMLQRIRFDRMNLPKLRYMTQAGGRLDPNEIIWLGKLGEHTNRKAFIMYGQTEATARIAYLPSDLIQEKPGSIGRAIPNGELWLVNDKGVVIELPNIEGQLMYTGPNVMLGYAETFQDLCKGRDVTALATGDLAYRDSDGCYWITGRLKRFLKLFGNRFSLDDVEHYLRTCGHEAIVVGRDDAMMVGVLATQDIADELRKNLSDRYGIHPSAIQVYGIKKLPYNNVGKPLYEKMQKILDSLETSS